MGFRLTPIFIKSEKLISDEEVLSKFGLSLLKKGEEVNFYETNKKWNHTFLGTKGNCKIFCNGELANKAFEEAPPFLKFENTEIAVIIWDGTSDYYGFCIFKNGKLIRKVAVCDGAFDYNYGHPIPEELEINEDKIFMQEEIAEIIENEGEEGYRELVKAEKICRAANTLASRYIGTGLVEIMERIELNEYK